MSDAAHARPADHETLLEAWGARVRANREQVERLRELPDPDDWYGPVSSVFRVDPRRTDEPALDALLALAAPDETWLDVGAGAGRYALPLALRVREVIAVEPSRGMADGLRAEMAAHAIANVRLVEGGWPPAAPTTGAPLVLGEVPVADAALIAHVSYDIEPVGPFLAALEAHARRRCVALLMERQPASVADPFWPAVHGEPRVPLPALRELLALLESQGRAVELATFAAPRRGWRTREEALEFLRRQLWIVPGSEKDARFEEAARTLLEERDGRWSVAGVPDHLVGLVSWAPGTV